MILHCVFCHLRADTSAAECLQVFRALSDLADTLPGVLAFDHGPNRDYENKSPEHGVGFVVRFADRASLERYAVHPTHMSLGARLCALCEGGRDGIVVYDIETQ